MPPWPRRWPASTWAARSRRTCTWPWPRRWPGPTRWTSGHGRAPDHRTGGRGGGVARLGGTQLHPQRLQLVHERRLHVRRLARELHRRPALQRLLEQGLQLQPRQSGAEAEVATARTEGLVLRVAGRVEAIGTLVDRLVAVRRRVPHHHLVALADLLPA